MMQPDSELDALVHGTSQIIHHVGGIEIRCYGEELDEVVAKGCAFHLEQMSDRGWWMGIYMPDGHEVMVNLVLEGTKSRTAHIKGVWDDDSDYSNQGSARPDSDASRNSAQPDPNQSSEYHRGWNACLKQVAEPLKGENLRLRAALQGAEWALNYLIHNYINLDGIPEDMAAEIQRVRVGIARAALDAAPKQEAHG